MSESRQVRRAMQREAAKPAGGLRPMPDRTYGRPRATDVKAETPGKGKFDGNCNRTDCQTPIAGRNFFNTSTRKFYCPTCAHLLNNESRRFDGIEICVPARTAEDQPPFPYEESKRWREEREARRARMLAAG